jgi:hypothetical protein
VAGEEVLDLVEAVVGEAEAGAVAEQEVAAEPAAEEEAGDSPAQAIVQASAIST